MSLRDALLRMAKAERKAQEIAKSMDRAGFRENPMYDIAGEIADAIYYLVGEHTETFDESVTYLVLNTSTLMDERRVAMLLSEYIKNVGPIDTKMPRPNTVSSEEIYRMMNYGDGYYRMKGENDDRGRG